MTWHTAWDAYDVPRLWDAVRNEDDPLGWEQVCGLRRMAGLLEAHAEGLRAKREVLARAWQSPASARMLDRWDILIATVGHEASSLTVTAGGLHGVMTALACAKRKIEPLTRQWNEITSDWIPEYWDEVAAEMNDEARTAMLVAAAEVRDHKDNLGVPARAGQIAATPPPALPGFLPVSADSPTLAGMPLPVAAVAGQPVSMLPIPPGNPYAPQGGAYLLPGPGVGGFGFIVPNPHAPGSPVQPRRRSSWHVPVGVPPVILPVSTSPGTPTPEAMAAFETWFTQFATPWRIA